MLLLKVQNIDSFTKNALILSSSLEAAAENTKGETILTNYRRRALGQGLGQLSPGTEALLLW